MKWNALPLFFLPLLSFNGKSKSPEPELTIAVAANMQYAIKEIVADFKNAEHVNVQVVLGSSGNLTQQIINGAPYGIFISADTGYPDKLYQRNMTLGKPKIYAKGLLVLWTMNNDIDLRNGLNELTLPGVRSIAVANPRNAPYGFAAIELLKNMKLYEKVKNKLVFGESIMQTSQFIATRAADAGFTAKSIVLSDPMKGKGTWIEMNKANYPPILQAAVMLTYGEKNDRRDVVKFFDFLFSPDATSIFNKFGYIVP
jgi:molybdate transport system substrate-binding protein